MLGLGAGTPRIEYVRETITFDDNPSIPDLQVFGGRRESVFKPRTLIKKLEKTV
jgi:hypothetical protein